MQKAVRKYLKALEAGDPDKAAALFTADGYYLYDWRLKDGSEVAFECADVFNFDPDSGHIASVVLVYDTHLVRDVVENKYP